MKGIFFVNTVGKNVINIDVSYFRGNSEHWCFGVVFIYNILGWYLSILNNVEIITKNKNCMGKMWRVNEQLSCIYRVGVRYVQSTVLTKLYCVRAALLGGKMRNYSEPWFLKRALKTFYLLLTFLGKTANLGWYFSNFGQIILENQNLASLFRFYHNNI